ncbi:MAG TPA: cadmium resistance transporter [Ohtaekwangia sp.]
MNILETLLTAFLSFVSTNIDDIVILMLFFGSKRYSSRDIVSGQYLGISSLVVVSYIFSRVGNYINPQFIGLLGLFPIYLSIKQFVSLLKPDTDTSQIDLNKTGIISLAGVTIANGSDNIGVYVPLFATMDNHQLLILVMIFLVMTGLWCLLGKYLASHPLLAKSISRFGHIIMPVVLFLLGVYILIESGAIKLFV